MGRPGAFAPVTGDFYMQKYFDINDSGYSVRSLVYCNDIRNIKKMIIFYHGFGGHKDNRAAARFAEFILSKYKNTGVLCFDWPAHGDDARSRLMISDCLLYMDFIFKYVRERWKVEEFYAYGTSFGGYMILRYLAEKGNPFQKIALRCPAVKSYEVIFRNHLSEEEKEKLAKGKDALAGFDRKVKINNAYLEELRAVDLMELDFMDYADDILIIHGSEDEIVPIESVQEFAENNVIECIPIEGADHRFRNPKQMDLAINLIAKFLMS